MDRVPVLLESLVDKRDRIIIFCGVMFGMRPSELLSLRWCDMLRKDSFVNHSKLYEFIPYRVAHQEADKSPLVIGPEVH